MSHGTLQVTKHIRTLSENLTNNHPAYEPCGFQLQLRDFLVFLEYLERHQVLPYL